MVAAEIKHLLNAGVHFGHMTSRWNPNMASYIFTKKKGIHIINLYKTLVKIRQAEKAIKSIVASRKNVLFVATKKQAKNVLANAAKKINMPYVDERWAGGTLTNFITIKRSIKKMSAIDLMKKDGTFETLSKKERLQIDRQRDKLEKNFGSIVDMKTLPGAVFVVDAVKEHIAVSETQKLNIPLFAIVDTNSDPRGIDFVIPANDDSSKSIALILDYITEAIAEGLREQKKVINEEEQAEPNDNEAETSSEIE